MSGAIPGSPRVREVRPDVVIAHWKHSIHTDHENASVLAERARFYAGLPMEPNATTGMDDPAVPRHGVRRLVYAENWEDAEGFPPSTYVPIPDEAFALWREAIEGQAFARGETYGFRYIDYYTALVWMPGEAVRAGRRERGCRGSSPANDTVDDARLPRRNRPGMRVRGGSGGASGGRRRPMRRFG